MDKEKVSEQIEEQLEQKETAKKQMPKVSPSTIIMTFIFALVFCVGVYFFPRIEALLPWGGTTVQGEVYIEKYTQGQLIEKAHSVVVGEVGDKRANIVQERPTADGLNYIVYSEVEIKVAEVLYGQPYVENGVLITYELGGRRESVQNGQTKFIKIEYKDAAKLGKGEKVILFLDDQNNILGEKYGVYRQHKDDYYYDDSQTVYSVAAIRSALNKK